MLETSELMQNSIYENAHVALDQAEYQKRYDALTARFDKARRDPDAHSVKKGNMWHFGYKAHVGVDRDTGLVHHVEVTGANVHDVTVVPRLLTGEEDTAFKSAIRAFKSL